MSVVYFTDRDLGLQFLEKHAPPFIAKVYRASPAELAKDASAPGNIVLWLNA